MGTHLNENGEFQSDKYPTCPPGKVPLSTKDPMAQDLLWEYAQRRRSVDAEFSEDLEQALLAANYVHDDTVCRRCDYSKQLHESITGVGLVCPVALPRFAPARAREDSSVPSPPTPIRVGSVVRHKFTQRVGTVTATAGQPDHKTEIWVDHTGPYRVTDFRVLE